MPNTFGKAFMKDKVAEYIKVNNMIPDGSSVLIALSGGQDSMCLADILMKLKEEKNLKLSAVHMEHGIRHDTSISDMEFVKDYCRDNGIELYIKQADIPAIASKQGKGLEQTAREQRYKFFEEVYNSKDIDVIATAHHGNDQAESVIINLVRGAALDGIAGMAPVNGKYIKPFLCVTKQEIEMYCEAEKIPYRVDATNSDPNYTRNYVRHIINPLLASINPNFIEAIMRNSEYIRAEKDYLERISDGIYNEIARLNGGDVVLDARRLADCDEPVRIRLYKKAASTVGINKDIYAVHYKLIDRMLCEGRKGSSLDMPGNLKVSLGHAGILFSTQNTNSVILSVSINGPGVYRLGEAKIVIEEADEVPQSFDKGIEYVDKDKWPLELVLRTRLTGDMFRPINGGVKKLKKFFIDKKLDNSIRDEVPLIAAGNEIMYIAGTGISERVKITDTTKKVYSVKCLYE